LPADLDIVIVATTSAVRESVITNLLKSHKVRFLVLEKVLFQQVAAYERVANLLQQYNVPAWVNHPRRMFSHYQNLQQGFAQGAMPVHLHVAGGNWGLGCNALHMIDLAAYLNNSSVHTIDASLLHGEIQEGKRKGYKEFTGTITGTLKNGALFTVSSFAGNRGPLSVYLSSSQSRCLLQEGGTAAQILLSAENNFALEHTTVQNFYQSGLTATLAQQLIETSQCELPTYQDATASHLPFISAMLQKYNQLTGLNTDTCPIT
jgi:hypothetical protein